MAVSTIDPAGLNIGQIGGRRNMLYNSAMQIAQRGTSATYTTTGQAYILDRFYKINGSSYAPNITISQATDAPSGFTYSLKVYVDTATTPASNQNLLVGQSLEGFDVAQLGYGTSDAKYITLSFWVKANQTGTRGVWFMVLGSTQREYMASFTINAAATWEYKTVTIPPNTIGGPDVDNTAGLLVLWPLSTGSGDQISASTDWVAQNAYRGLSGEPDLCDTAGNYIQITGTQLELNDVATPFEHRSYGEELSACQRYFNNLVSYGGSSVTGVLNLASYSTNYAYGAYTFPVEMRAAPSVSYSNLADFKSRFGNNVTPTTITTHGTTSNKQTTIQIATTCTAGQAGWLEAVNSSAYIYLDAEL